MRFVITLACTLVVPGCAGKSIADLPEAKRHDDRFSPHRTIETATLRTGTPPNVVTLKLVAKVDRSTATAAFHAHLQVAYQDFGARHYGVARNIRAQPLTVTKVAHTSTGCRQKPCQYVDDMQVALGEAELRQAAASGGYAFKIFAREGPEHRIDVPAQLIASLMRGLETSPPMPARPHP